MSSTPAVDTLRDRHLRVLLADEEDEVALERLGDVLAELGHEALPFAVSVEEAADLIVREDPDLAIVVLDRDDEHALALIGESVELASGPVIAQLREGDVDFVARAAERGISAYVASNDPEHVQAAIEVAVRRYREAALLHDEIGQLEGALDRRAVIERAKGMLMERHGVDEREAFERLRNHARAATRRVVDVAEDVLDGHVLRPWH